MSSPRGNHTEERMAEQALARVGPIPDPNAPPIKRLPTKIRPIVDGKPIEFFAHQREGIRLLARRSSWLLADQMGLGKTLQSMTVAALDFDRGWASRVLVICGATDKWNFFDEVQKLTTFDVEVLHRWPTKTKTAVMRQREQIEDFTGDVLICNYEQVASHLNDFRRFAPDIVIVDEAHMIKNYEAQRTKAIHQLTPKRWFLLTGTPLETRPDELWSPLRLIDPDNTPSYFKWCNRHIVYETGTRRVRGVKNQDELRERVAHVMLRRLKKDCIDLPDKQWIKINVELSDYQRKLHDQAQEELWIELPDDPEGMELESSLTRALRLQQICSTPFNIEGHPDDSAKLDVAIEKLEELLGAGEKVGVFTRYRGTMACLEERMKQKGMTYWLHHGGISGKARQANSREWKAHDGPAVIAGMYQTMGKGLTLTAASHCIMIDKMYGPGIQEQAEDRFHRIGQTEPVTIIELIARNTYEQRVEAILARKEEMIDGLIENSGISQKVYQAILEGKSNNA